jgi:serine/threonine-protein kinase
MNTKKNKSVNPEEVRYFVKFPIYMLSFILLGLIFGYLTFKVLSFSRTVEVPALAGKNVLEANKLLTEKGLYLKIEGEDYDPEVPTGHILRQGIPAGNKVKERRAIKVVISKGPRVRSIPLLVHETLLDAEALLLQKGLKISKIIQIHSNTVEKDHVVAQKPAPHERVSDHITVLVSLGTYDKIYTCPDFRGMYLDRAQVLAKNLNLAVSINGDGDKVETQTPRPYSEIKSGDTIYLKVYEVILPEEIVPEGKAPKDGAPEDGNDQGEAPKEGDTQEVAPSSES